MTTVLIAIFVTVFDQLVKWIVVSHMELGETIPLIRNVFHLTYILNPGAAFGLLPHQDWFFLAIVAIPVSYTSPSPRDRSVSRMPSSA